VRLLVLQTMFGLSYSTFILLPKFLKTELDASAWEIGAVAAMFGAATTLVTPIAGVWVDRFGRRQFVAWGAFVMIWASLGFVWVDSLGPLAYWLRFLQGAAFSLAFVAGGALVTDQAPKERLGQAIGLYGLTMLSTNAIAPALAEGVADRVGWAPAFVAAGVAAAVAFALAFTLREHAEPPENHEDLPSLWSVVSTRRALWFMSISGLGGFAFGAMFTFSQPFALDLGMTHVRGFFAAYAAMGIFVRIGLGELGDRAGRNRVSVLTLGLYAVCVFWMAGLTPGSLVPIGAAFGVAHGMFYPAFNALVMEPVSDLARGKVYAIFIGAFNAGWGVAGLALGQIAEVYGYPTVFVCSGFAVLLALALLVSAREIRAPAHS
jgi:MFS family permease